MADYDILTPEEAMKALRLTTLADEVEEMVTGLTGWVVKLCGPVVVETVTAVLSGPYSGPLLFTGMGTTEDGRRVSITPTFAVTEVVETRGTTPTTLVEADYDLKAEEHYVRLFRRSGGYDSAWAPGARNIALTIEAGRFESTDTVGFDFKERFRSLLREKWQYESATWARNRGEFQTDDLGNPVGFNTEARIRDLFASELLPPGIA